MLTQKTNWQKNCSGSVFNVSLTLSPYYHKIFSFKPIQIFTNGHIPFTINSIPQNCQVAIVVIIHTPLFDHLHGNCRFFSSKIRVYRMVQISSPKKGITISAAFCKHRRPFMELVTGNSYYRFEDRRRSFIFKRSYYHCKKH